MGDVIFKKHTYDLCFSVSDKNICEISLFIYVGVPDVTQIVEFVILPSKTSEIVPKIRIAVCAGGRTVAEFCQ